MVLREYEIDPDAEPAVQAAVVDALERLAAEDGLDEPPGNPRCAWRLAARREAVEPRFP